MKKLLLASFFTLILPVLLVNSPHIMSISEGSPNDTAIVDINTNPEVSNLVYDVISKPYDVSYANWTEKWWQWTYSIPWDKNPSYDDTGKYCSENQIQPVWFLTLAYEHPVIRSCDIPENTALLITLYILNALMQNSPC